MKAARHLEMCDSTALVAHLPHRQLQFKASNLLPPWNHHDTVEPESRNRFKEWIVDLLARLSGCLWFCRLCELFFRLLSSGLY